MLTGLTTIAATLDDLYHKPGFIKLLILKISLKNY